MIPGRSCPPWRETLAPFAVPCLETWSARSRTSVVPYGALCVVMYLTLGVSPALTAVLIVAAAGFLVRVFVMFHDCAHGSLLPSRRANAVLGSILGLPRFGVLDPDAAYKGPSDGAPGPGRTSSEEPAGDTLRSSAGWHRPNSKPGDYFVASRPAAGPLAFVPAPLRCVARSGAALAQRDDVADVQGASGGGRLVSQRAAAHQLVHAEASRR